MVLPPDGGAPIHARFRDLPDWLHPTDLLVFNDTRVFPARLTGHKEKTGGRCEVLLLEYPHTDEAGSGPDPTTCQCPALVRSSKRPRPGTVIVFSEDFRAVIIKELSGGKMLVEIGCTGTQDDLDTLLHNHGQIPLPPYIRRPEGTTAEDRDRYQTRYARRTGSVAAPTAGLHFSDDLLQALADTGIETCAVTLHVGYGTFAPVRVEDIREHRLHREMVSVSPETAAAVNRARAENRRIWAVGTTTVRTLEFAADAQGRVRPLREPCDLYIYPGFRFQVVDNLITNFHLPGSSLLFLVSALVGRKRLLAAYREAVRQQYRFFSYGDAMAVIRK